MTFQTLRKHAVGYLGLSLMEYYDRTLFELSIELEGYNLRWEEQWSPFRALYTLIANYMVGKNKQKKPWEYMPFPSEAEMIRLKEKSKDTNDSVILMQSVNGRGDGGSRVKG